MPNFPAADPGAPYPFPDGLLPTLLAVSLSAVNLLRPLYDATGEQLVDFHLDYLNPAAQRMTGLPEQPGTTVLTCFPHLPVHGVFDFYVRTFRTGAPATFEVNYQADGLDNYYCLAAQRCGDLLVVSFTDTSDQPRTPVENALRESQAAEQHARAEAEQQRQRFREVLTQMPAFIAVYQGPDHIYQFVNPAYQSLFPHRSFLGLPFREGTPEAVELGVVALFDQVYQTGEPVYLREIEGWFDFHGTGQPVQVFLNISLHPLRDVQGRIDGVLDFTYDVSEQVRVRRQVEQLNQELEARVAERTAQLEEQQNLLRQILRNVPAAIATLSGPTHRFSFANARYQHLVGSRATVGQAVAEALPEVVEQGVIELLDRVYQTGEPFLGSELIIMLEQPPGSPHQCHYDLTYLALRDGQGQVQGILVFAVDVTERVHTRRQTATLQAELLAAARRQAQERQDLYQVFEQTPAAIVLLREPSHTIDYYNPAFAATFPLAGPAAEDLHGRKLAEVYPRMQEAGLVKLLDRVYATGEPQVVLEMPLAELHAGSERYVTFAYQAYREQGRIVGVAAFVYDATEQVLARQQVLHLNQELHTTNAQLTRTNADLDTFIYTASHDLKAPIANIEGLMQALRQELAAQLPSQKTLDYILHLVDDSVTRFQRTIDHLTEAMQLQHAGLQWQEGEADLAGLIEDVRLDLTPALEASQAQVSVEVPCPPVRCSPKDVRSIIYNLLSNAIKYRAREGRPVVQVRAQCTDQWLTLQVQDNGLGLTPPQQDKLFGLFQRLHPHVEGSGVGLYAIKKLVDNAGGTITVESQAGVGSTFTVRLPLGLATP